MEAPEVWIDKAGNIFGPAYAGHEKQFELTKYIRADLTRWVSVDERLPEVGQAVLFAGFYMDRWIMWAEQNYRPGEELREGWTHWQPLPPPPTGAAESAPVTLDGRQQPAKTTTQEGE